MTPQQFIAKWQAANLSERSACQQHFLDLCELLGQEKPAAADPDGAWYCFERGVSKTEGGQGWADVWMRGHFGWEYKGKHKDLGAAYKQLLQYRESLDNPPLLVVCDLNRFEVHTNFTGTAKRVYDFDLAGLAQPKNLEVLRRLFTEPDALRPGITSQSVTDIVSEKFGLVADALRQRKIPPPDVAHFLMKLMFSMFAEDIDLLPSRIFTRTLKQSKNVPAKLSQFLQELFTAMAAGGSFAMEEIPHFNGGLFADAQVIDLTASEIQHLADAADQDWSSVEPHIFGTLFERLLDPDKRSQIGAHYTSSADIRTLLEPVMMTPLRREWAAVKQKCEAILQASGVRKLPDGVASSEGQPYREAYTSRSPRTRRAAKESPARRKFNKLLRDFVERLAHVTVLDPACGSGNFLYVALRLLLDLEKEVITFAAGHKLGLLPQVRPTQLHGIEINPYAQELASVVIWIGYLQWMRDNGFVAPSNPVLEPIESIEQRDAILDLSDPEHPKEPQWPEAEFIVGNPPFLGNKQLKSELGADYANALRLVYDDRLPGMSDLCCYWFEKAKDSISTGKCKRAGLLATTGITQVGARKVLERVAETVPIFWAVADRDWVLNGAAVRISMVGFGELIPGESPSLDGQPVQAIHANLTSGLDLTASQPLASNQRLCFMGTTKVGDFDIPLVDARSLLSAVNPNHCPSSDMMKLFRNGSDLVRDSSDRWIIDFGVNTPMEIAAAYEAPFEFVVKHVKPDRIKNNDKWRREHWWLLGRSIKEFRKATASRSRYIGTPRVSKHRIFVWLDCVILPDSKVIAIAFDDDFHFGVLHSRIHEVWTLATCAWHGKGNDATYNPTTCFETFPFPEPTGEQREAIAQAAAELDRLRTAWLNPPEWTREEILEFPGSTDGPWARFIGPTQCGPAVPAGHAAATNVDLPDRPSGKTKSSPLPVRPGQSDHIGTVRYPRLVPKDAACAKELKKRTLTNLYNQRPQWLALAHQKLDAAVFAAYGWPATFTDDELLARLLALNLALSSAAR